MPALSVSSIDRFIEPAGFSKEAPSEPSIIENSVPFSFYPPLYATPSQQRPSSPTAFSPSPYVVNFKRRGSKRIGEGPTVINPQHSLQEQRSNVAGQGTHIPTVSKDQARFFGMFGSSLADKHHEQSVGEVPTESEVFDMEIEKQDGINSLATRTSKSFLRHLPSTTGEDGTHAASSISSLATNEEVEFFDAPEFTVSDSASEDEAFPSSTKPGRCGGGCDGRTTPRLQEEIVRRIKAEDAISYWQARWSDMAKRVATAGLSASSQNEEPQEDQQVVVARLVAGAIASAAARAENDEELESLLAAKNREISRLWDKLQYLELINREMSQRNQEVIESAQRSRRRRQKRQRWVLGGLGAALCMGTAGLIFYKVMPWDQAKAWTASLKRWSPSSEPSSTDASAICCYAV